MTPDEYELFIFLDPIVIDDHTARFEKCKRKSFTLLPSAEELKTGVKPPKHLAAILYGTEKERKDPFQECIEKFLNEKRKVSHSVMGKFSSYYVIQPTNVADCYRFSESFVYDSEAEKIIDPQVCTPEGLEKMAAQRLGEAFRAHMADHTYVAQVINDPFLPFGISESKDGHEVFNVYKPPAWHFVKKARNVKDFKILFRHLFPVKKERKFVARFMLNAITSRNDFCLLLSSPPGTGKGLFCKAFAGLVSSLPDDVFSAPESFSGQSHFNDYLKDSRLCILDETVLTHILKERIKRLLNPLATLEGKGKKPTKNTKILADIVICNNFKNQNYLVFNDRRFFVPQLGSKNFDTVFNEQRIDKLSKNLEKPAYLRGIYDYLFEIATDNNRLLRTDTFFDIVFLNLPLWQQTILESATQEKRDIIEIQNLHKLKTRNYSETDKDRKFGTQRQIKNFLNTYLHRGDIPVGKIEGDQIIFNRAMISAPLTEGE